MSAAGAKVMPRGERERKRLVSSGQSVCASVLVRGQSEERESKVLNLSMVNLERTSKGSVGPPQTFDKILTRCDRNRY